MSKGFAGIYILIIIPILGAIGGIYYFAAGKNIVPVLFKTSPVACTQEVKQCPDGSYVSREGPNCEFKPCPVSAPTPTSDETANWKTYSDKNNYFLVRYPDFTKFIDIKTTYNTPDVKAYISIAYSPTSPVEPDRADKIFQLSIQVKDNSTNKTAQQLIQELQSPKYKVSDIKPYKKGEIDGTYYTVWDSTSEVGQNSEVILQARGDTLYVFRYEAWNGAFVEGRGKEMVDQILSTFKFLPTTAGGDQNKASAEGKFCGGIAANLPENQCPGGYKCQLDGNYPDAGGKCVKI